MATRSLINITTNLVFPVEAGFASLCHRAADVSVVFVSVAA
jgi:hypothetical protein